MTKKKSKKDQNLQTVVGNNSANSAMDFFKDNAKQIGATIAGLIVAEIAQATVDQLLKKLTKDENESGSYSNNVGDPTGNAIGSNLIENVGDPTGNAIGSNLIEKDTTDNGLQTATTRTIADLKGKVEDIKAPVEASVQSVKATAVEVPPALSGIAELVKEATQKAIAQSMDKIGDSLSNGELTSQALVAGAVDSAKDLVGAIASKSDRPSHKSKKKGKKKHKKS